jgi:Domain of Unknown Function (DUF1080)
MSKKNNPSKVQNNTHTDKEKSDNSVKIAIIGGVVTIVVTIISVLIAPVVLEKMKETPSPTTQALSTNIPLVNATSTPQETATPTNLIYSNDFSNSNGGFPVGATVDDSRVMKQSVVDGEYHWDNTSYGSFLTKLIPNDIQVLSNFEVSVDVKITGTDIGKNSSIGLMIRNSNDQYYYFGVRPKESVYLMAENEYRDGNWNWDNFPNNGKSSPAILQEGFNNLKVVADKDSLTFYVNNALIADIVDDRIKNGNIGLLIYSHENILTTFIIDNFQVRQLP